MTDMTLRLITRAQNSAGERVRIALNLKALDYDYVPIAELTPQAFIDLNPQGLLPALQVDGQTIAQSSAILDFLEEYAPRPSLLPTDPWARAHARAFASYIAAEMHAVTVRRIRTFLAGTYGIEESGIEAWLQHWTQSGLQTLETMLIQRPTPFRFCYDDTPGWADLHLVPQMRNARRFGVDLAPYPHLRAIDDACNALDVFRRARPEAQPDFGGS